MLLIEPKRSDFCLLNDDSRDKTAVVLLLCDLVKLASRDDSLGLFFLRITWIVYILGFFIVLLKLLTIKNNKSDS